MFFDPSDALTLGLRCPSGGNWYSCTSKTRSYFVGCCSSDNPCDTGCAEVRPVAYNGSSHGLFPNATCGSGSAFYTCGVDPTGDKTFWGCCKSNPCAKGPQCPSGQLSEAFLDAPGQINFYGIVGELLEMTPVQTAPVSRMISALATSTHIANVEKLGREKSLAPLGLSVAVMGLASLAVIVWLCYRRRIRLVHNKRHASNRALLQPQIVVSDHDPKGKGPSHSQSLRSCDIDRLGTRCLGVLGLTILVELCICAFLAFLWYGHANNRIWHRIMVNGWATRSISIAALVLRTAVGLQAGIGSSILAALLLESKAGVRLHQIASFSPMRTGGTSPSSFIWCVLEDAWRSGSFFCHSRGLHVIAGCLLLTTTLLQFSSTLLLTDLSSGPLMAQAYRDQVRPDFSYMTTQFGIPRSSAWTINPPSYPTFAEYHEPIQNRDGNLADTGLLLRALLPFELAETRQRLSSYSGNAMVLDARVSCQAPSLADLKLDFDGGYRSADYVPPVTFAQIAGVAASTKNSSMLQEFQPTNFNCTVAGKTTTICQLQQPEDPSKGSLKSQFHNSTSIGTAFLVLNANGEVEHPPTWQEFNITRDAIDRKLTAWASLCFAPWNSAVLKVSLSSKVNRVESPLQYIISDFTRQDSGAFQTDRIMTQLIPSTNNTGRQILDMKLPGSYSGDLPPPRRRPLVQSDIGGSLVSQTTQLLPGNWSAIVTTLPLARIVAAFEVAPKQYIATDPAVAAIFNAVLNTTSIEWAMSALITIFSMTNYYGQQPAFDRLDTVTISFFEDFLYPRDHLGLTLMAWALTAHLLIVALLVIMFVLKTRLTLLGNAWSAFVQVAESQEVMAHVANSSLRSDAQIIKGMRETHTERLRGRLVRKDGGAEVVV